MDLKNVTVIIPTKNEEKNIITFLDSLPKHINLIVVDSSTDRTRELITIRRPHNTTILHEECNIPVARQKGADNCNSEWLVYSDVDIAFDENYFGNIEILNPSEKVGAIMGPKLSKVKYKWYYRLYAFTMMLLSWINLPIGSGSNMIIRKSVLDKIGGFDPELSAGEDNDILIRIMRSGYKILYKNNLKVYEMDHRRLESGMLRKYFQGTFRMIWLMLGLNRKKLQQSDWGYWDKSNKQ